MLLALFFASGLAGLIYEVCWVREFGNEFGNTVHSASLVAAVFMCGLGIGSWAAGGWADRRASEAPFASGAERVLFRAYGIAELGIATFGALLAWLLPRLGGLSASASSYARDANGWNELSLGSHALRYAVAIALVAPPTVLMGATLTLLVRATLARDVAHVGWRIGLLYGANTAGAALGAFACDAFLVPRAGIVRTQLVAAALNVAVGIGALALARRRATTTAASPSEDRDPSPAPPAPPPPAPPPRAARRVLLAGCAALALSGFAALGMEIVWFRFLSATIGAFRPIFSLVLTVILVGIWLGATLGGYCQRRYGHALELFVAAQGAFVVAALALMAAFTSAPATTYATAAQTIAFVVGLPALLMGFSFPLVNAHVQDAVGSVGRRAGSMYFANTLGSVAGSLAAGFVLAPWIGSQTSFAVFAVIAALAPFALVLVAPDTRPLRAVAGGTALVAILSIAAWCMLPTGFLNRRFMASVPASTILDEREGPNEIIDVLDCGGDCRILATNGHSMSGTSLPSQRYMRAFAHLPLVMTQEPERALVICFGVGNTANATSLHPSLKRIEIADLSRNVLEHASFFARTNHDVLSDPRVSVFVEDGRQHLRQAAPDSYDLVTLEPPPISFAGVSSLYSREFYELVRSRLKPDGFTTQWMPIYDVPPEIGLAMVRAFLDVFPASALLSGNANELILLGTRRTELVLDLDAVETTLASRPAVLADLRRTRLASLTDLVGTFVADADALRRVTAGITPVTDDRPTMEYTFGRDAEISASLFDGTRGGLRRFCPKCFTGESPDALDPRVRRLPDHMAVLDRLYATKAFRTNAQPFVLDVDAHLADAIARSPYLTSVVRPAKSARPPPRGATAGVPVPPEARAHFARGFDLAQQGDLASAARELEQGLAIAPRDVDARYNLAVIHASAGREDDAVAEAKKVLEDNPSYDKAKQMLCSLRGLDCAP